MIIIIIIIIIIISFISRIRLNSLTLEAKFEDDLLSCHEQKRSAR